MFCLGVFALPLVGLNFPWAPGPSVQRNDVLSNETGLVLPPQSQATSLALAHRIERPTTRDSLAPRPPSLLFLHHGLHTSTSRTCLLLCDHSYSLHLHNPSRKTRPRTEGKRPRNPITPNPAGHHHQHSEYPHNVSPATILPLRLLRRLPSTTRLLPPLFLPTVNDTLLLLHYEQTLLLVHNNILLRIHTVHQSVHLARHRHRRRTSCRRRTPVPNRPITATAWNPDTTCAATTAG